MSTISSTVMCSPTVGTGLGGMALGGRGVGEDGICWGGRHGDWDAWSVWVVGSGEEIQATSLTRGV